MDRDTSGKENWDKLRWQHKSDILDHLCEQNVWITDENATIVNKDRQYSTIEGYLPENIKSPVQAANAKLQLLYNWLTTKHLPLPMGRGKPVC